jgi:6-phosphogluconolactonase
MKHFSLVIGFLIFVFTLSAQNSGSQYFYVGSYTSEGAEGIYLCQLNTATGEIQLEKTFTGIENPSFVKLSPSKQILYAVSEAGENGSFVYAYKVGDNKTLGYLNKQSSGGQGPCHVDVSPDGKFVAVANYGGGTFSLYSVREDGSIDPAVKTIRNSGTGPNTDRQSKPHAHSVRFSPFSNEIFNADLGTDQLNICHLENGTMVQHDQKFVKLPPGAGPRHFEFHPNGRVIYVINELNSTISTIVKKGDEWKVVDNISTLPDDFEGVSYCADIHISKDGKFLYGSNRGHNSIAVFKVDPKDQSLSFLETVSVEGNWPRNFGITPDGNWMLVANQRSNTITVFKIDKKTGGLKYAGNQIELPSPVCVEFY